MNEQILRIAGRRVQLHGCLNKPEFRRQRVLCSDPWDYVSLWLKRAHKSEAHFYWDQARHFFEASKSLPALSAPLTSYYCLLNASKALLSSVGHDFKEAHGVGGRTVAGNKSLQNEIVDFRGAGVLSALCKYLGEPDNGGNSHTVKDIMWRLPFIHRAYCLTYRSSTELFVPLLNNQFVRKAGSKEAWFQAELDKQYVNSHTKHIVRPGFEVFQIEGRTFLRRKKRFAWHGHDIEGSLKEFSRYHKTIRSRVQPIYSSGNRWYLKKSVSGHDNLKNSQMTLIYAVMHRLSELSRYEPVTFNGHFNLNHNWLLTEFIRMAPGQFIYAIASEITGLEFLTPDAFN